jgi:hypothetical protein
MNLLANLIHKLDPQDAQVIYEIHWITLFHSEYPYQADRGMAGVGDCGNELFAAGPMAN